MPVHWGTFSLAMHAWDEPADTLLAHAPSRDVLVMPRLGEAQEPAEQRPVKAWWRKPEGAPPPSSVAAEEPASRQLDEARAMPWPLD
jgi:hypothetical protein